MNFKTALCEIVKVKASFTLFTAPLAWGKTRAVWDILETDKKIIFLCPLRSIVEEVKGREHSLIFEGEKKRHVLDKFCQSEKAVLVATVESFPWHEIERIIKEVDPLFVLDEFHLFFEWGRDFRPLLFDFYRELILLESRVMGITATFPKELVPELHGDILRNEMSFLHIDLGNFKFTNKPQGISELRSKDLIDTLKIRAISPFSRGKIIVFVRTKIEVQRYYQYFVKRGVAANYCIGGEVKDFEQREKRKSKVIICTSVLSHGVNIKDLRSVFILYEPSPSFYTQMLGRGGRFGEKFKAYTLKTSQETSIISKIGLFWRRLQNEILLDLCELLL